MTNDTGFAPHPFGGHCTLATCKPEIRRCARKIWDEGSQVWVAAIGSASGSNGCSLIYAMRVDEIFTFDEYSTNARFINRRPENNRLGDNIFERDGSNQWTRRQSEFHTTPADLRRDVIRGQNVLVSQHFYYFGRNAVVIPTGFRHLFRSGVGHTPHNHSTASPFVCWLETNYNPGLHGLPVLWRGYSTAITISSPLYSRQPG